MSENLTQDQKIDYLIKKIDELETQLNPPVWKKLISWFFTHIWTLLFLAIIGYFMWQIWEMVQAVQAAIDSVSHQVTSVKTSVSDSLAPVNQSLDSVKEKLQGLSLEKVKFW